MGLFIIKEQGVRAGSFTVRFGSHRDDSGTCYVQITGATEGHQITFKKEGDVIKVQKIFASWG